MKKIEEILSKTANVAKEYPFVLLMALLGSVSLMCFAHGNYNDHPNFFVFIKFAITACLGISLMFALKIFSQRTGKGVIPQLLGIAFLVFFYFLMPEKESDFTEKYAFLIIPTVILSHLLVSFAAFLSAGKETNFWQYNKNLFINIFLTGIFTAVLTGGVMLAILAVDKLFDFNFDDRLYTETFYLLSIFGSSVIFLLFCEAGLQNLEKGGNYPLVLQFFTQYILIPLLIIYVVILYFYAFKILLNWELPRGWVSYLILAYSVVGILALLLVHPLKQDSAKSWVKLFSKIFYYSLAPLLVLLFIAIFTRILAYGYTEARYFVLLLAVWLATVVLYFIFAKRSTIKFIPISLFVYGFLSLTLPFLNTFSVAKRSQKSELINILKQNQLLRNEKINFGSKISDAMADEISSKFQFLASRGENIYLMNLLASDDAKILGKILNKTGNHAIYGPVRNRFSNVSYKESTSTRNRLEIYAEKKLQNVAGYQYMISFDDLYSQSNYQIGQDNLKIHSSPGQPELKLEIILNNSETLDLAPFIRETFEKNRANRGLLEMPEIATKESLGNYEIKVIFHNILYEASRKESLSYNGAYILIRKKEQKVQH